MKKKMIYILCLMFILPLTANAQGKKATKTKKKAKVAVQEENSKFTAMLGQQPKSLSLTAWWSIVPTT